MRKPRAANPRKRRFQNLSINRMIPNMLTLLALSAGLTAIRFALDGRWEHATLAIVAAGILDALDGRIARLLKGASKFGAELDSLSDFVCFGVSPGLVLYLWTMHNAGKLGWVLVMLFAICCGLRLARFNVMLEDTDAPPWKARFFVLITPLVMVLALLPVVGGIAYLASCPVRRGPLFRIALDEMALEMPFSLYRRLHLARWLAPKATPPGQVEAALAGDAVESGGPNGS